MVILDFAEDGAVLTKQGLTFLASIGVEIAPRGSETARGATFCRPCLDWSERRPHVAGVVGAALYRRFVERDWVRPVAASRAVSITPFGMREFERYFRLSPD